MVIPPDLLAILMVGGVLLLLLIGMPIGFAMGISGLLGMWAILGIEIALPSVTNLAFNKLSSYLWTTIPLFILMGHFVLHSGVVGDVFSLMSRWLWRLPGALAVATSASAAAFAACSGSSLATVATMGRVAIGEMRERGYDMRLAAGCVAASGTMGSLIPPSIYLIVYAMFTEQSITKMFLAGVIPGLLELLIYAGLVVLLCWRNPGLAPRLANRNQALLASLAGRSPSPARAVMLLLLGAMILGGIYTGIFTPTEAGAVGAFAAFLLALSMRGITGRKLQDALGETAEATVTIFVIVVGAMILSRAIGLTGLPSDLSHVIAESGLPPMAIIVGFCAMYIVLGMFLDPLGMVLLTLPVVFPVVIKLGFDPIWFGIIMIKVMEIGLITPPLGLNVYMLRSSNPDIPLGTINRGIAWFFCADLVHLAILLAFPVLSTWLPSLMDQ